MSTVSFANKEFKREITKDFTVGLNPNLSVENKYGNIRIIEGTENKIMFRIEIIGKGNTQALAEKYAGTVDIDFNQTGNNVSAITRLKDIICNNNCGRTIHYTIVVPRSVTLSLINKYGNISLDNSIKPLEVDLKYGNIDAITLADVNIDLKYGNINFKSCAKANIKVKYSKIKIDKADDLKFDSKYDDIKIGTVNNVNINTGYTDVDIKQLDGSFIADAFNYTNLDIERVATIFSRIKIDAKYSNVNIPLNNGHSFKANLGVRYGNIKVDGMNQNNAVFLKGRKESSLVGAMGNNPNSQASVNISVSYGDICLN
jgi:hypothetical protein